MASNRAAVYFDRGTGCFNGSSLVDFLHILRNKQIETTLTAEDVELLVEEGVDFKAISIYSTYFWQIGRLLGEAYYRRGKTLAEAQQLQATVAWPWIANNVEYGWQEAAEAAKGKKR